jgi:hypothetical protein
MGLGTTKGDYGVVRPVADAPGSVMEPEHGTASVSEGLAGSGPGMPGYSARGFS